MMKRFIFLILLMLLIGNKTYADSTICGLNPASTLSGTECIPIMQNGLTVKTTPNAISSFSSTINLGVSLTATDPRISGDASSGLYTPVGSSVAIATGGAQRALYNSTGESITGSITGSSTLTLGTVSGTTGSVSLKGTTSGTAILTAQAAAGTPTISIGTSTGTIAAVATSPLAINATSGVISCATCAVTGSSVASFSAGTTGLTPNTATTGAVTLAGTLAVANGGTNASSASITAFNNITGYTAAGATGTTSTNLVFSTSPSLVTPALGMATATSLAINGATIGANGLAVTGTVASGAVTSTGNVYSGAASLHGWTNRSNISSPSDGILLLQNNGSSSFTSLQLFTDSIITRAAAANIHLGAADAASAVAQTFGVQNVVAGTSNIAGANFTITGSQGTGTGVGGSIIFQTAPAGTTGTSQNALANQLVITTTGVGIGTTLSSTGTVLDLGNNTSSMLLPIGTTGQRPGTGINGMLRYNSTSTAIEGYVNNSWSSLLSGTQTSSTFTPAITFGGGNTGITYATRAAHYKQIGDVVYAWGRIALSSKGSSSGTALMTTLPVTSANDAEGFSCSLSQINNFAVTSVTQIITFVNPNATTMAIQRYSAGSLSNLSDGDFTNTSDFQFTCIYPAT